jgi:hypothetical protein
MGNENDNVSESELSTLAVVTYDKLERNFDIERIILSIDEFDGAKIGHDHPPYININVPNSFPDDVLCLLSSTSSLYNFLKGNGFDLIIARNNNASVIMDVLFQCLIQTTGALQNSVHATLNHLIDKHKYIWHPNMYDLSCVFKHFGIHANSKLYPFVVDRDDIIVNYNKIAMHVDNIKFQQYLNKQNSLQFFDNIIQFLSNLFAKLGNDIFLEKR